jgi:RecT family
MSNLVSFNDMQHMAEAIAKSGLFGMKDTNSVLALMAVAQAEGLHPATAARDFHIIQGRPALKADAMLARFQNAGGKVDWVEYTDERVTGIFTHPNGGSLSVTWSFEQASRIGLVKPGSGWQKFPRAMLRSRCISEGIRSVFPGSVTGFYSPEEVESFEERPPRDITPKAPPTVVMQGSEPVEVEVLPQVKTIPLYIPNQSEPYANFVTQEDWIAGYVDMYRKIKINEKLTEDDKYQKYEAFREVNQTYLNGMHSTIYANIISGINRVNKELNHE